MLRVEFYLGQNVDSGLGESISESSEQLFRSDFNEEGRSMQTSIKHTRFLQKVIASLMKVTANQEEQVSP